MPRTTNLSLEKIATRENIIYAIFQETRSMRQKPDVIALLNSLDHSIARISESLQQGRLPEGSFNQYMIHSPKQRIIHAAPLADRIAHHALMRFASPRLERALMPSVYACRVNKGMHRVVLNAQQHVRRYRWVMHTDILRYSLPIDYQVLKRQLHRRFRGGGCLLLDSVINSHGQDNGKVLPIGALTSQHFIKHYLSEMDRWCLAQSGVEAHCRYMDDQVLWSNDKSCLIDVQQKLTARLNHHFSLDMKPALIQKTTVGITFCGIGIKPYQLRVSLRRRRRFQQALDRIESQWKRHEIDALELQQLYASIHSILLPADEQHFRRRVLAHRDTLDA